MINKKTIHRIINCLIASVWFANGFFCKLLNLVPRHQLIVSRILGTQHAYFFTKAIGISEVLMTIWIISSIEPRLCATTQIIIVLTMNIIEFILVPDLLLFGKVNLLVAIFFSTIIFFNEFILHQKTVQPH